MSKLSIGLTSLPLFVLMFYLTRDDKKNEKLFKRLSRRYRDERFKVLKGIGIWILQLGSFIAMVISAASWK